MKRLIQALICAIVTFLTVSLHGEATESVGYETESESVVLCIPISGSEKVIVSPKATTFRTAKPIEFHKSQIPKTAIPKSVKTGIRFCVFRE